MSTVLIHRTNIIFYHFIKTLAKHKKYDKTMDKVFADLEKAGKNDVENLIKWMKDSKIVDPAKDEMELRKLFKDVGAQQQVDIQKFKAVIERVAAEQSKTLDQLSKQLAAEAPKIIDAALKGLNAFKEALK